MHPILFKIPIFGGLTIYTYGVMVALGFVAGIIWVSYESKRVGVDTGKALDLIFYLIIAAIIGSRLLFLIVNNPMELITRPWSLFMVWEGGLVFFGGLIGCLIVAYIYCRRKGRSILTFLDLFAPAIAIGHAFGRIGCFMSGCCHGRESTSSWCYIVFPDTPHTFAPVGAPVYPTQIIESLGLVIIFIGLVLFRKYKKFEGNVFAVYLVAYSILRFINEMFRGDFDRGYIIPGYISTSQGVSILLFGIGIAMLVWGYRRKNV